MQTSPSILLISHRPSQLYDRVLEANGFTVDFAHSIEAAQRLWQPGKYRLLLVEPNRNLKDALHFCSETKKTDPQQRFALMTTHRWQIQNGGCPDDVIVLQYNPELFVQKVSELIS